MLQISGRVKSRKRVLNIKEMDHRSHQVGKTYNKRNTPKDSEERFSENQNFRSHG
jgi:hypothetical protein